MNAKGKGESVRTSPKPVICVANGFNIGISMRDILLFGW